VKHELAWVCARTACEQLLAQFHDKSEAGRATESLGLFTSDAVLDLPLTERLTLHAPAGFDFTLSKTEALS
jgi:hypothetical protein